MLCFLPHRKLKDRVLIDTSYEANESVLKSLNLDGKVLVDCTNPVGPGLSHGLESTTSGSEIVQELAPGAKVVKAFTIYGWETFDNPSFENGVTPELLITGDDAEAKSIVTKLVKDVGFKAVDAGPLSSSVHLEHMTLLWIKMVRLGKHPRFAFQVVNQVSK